MAEQVADGSGVGEGLTLVTGPGHPGPDPSGAHLLPSSEPVQLLAPDGTQRTHPDHQADLDTSELVELLRLMVVTRRVDAEAISLQRQGQLGVYASCLGQEAAQVGSARALRDDDWMFPSYRELGAALVRGVDAVDLLHQFRGTWLSGYDPYAHRFSIMTIPIGTQALHATGFAMGARLDGNPIVTLCYVGDGATSEGDTHEALTFAGVTGAPIVFFVQNNGYAISVPVAEQTAAPTLAHKAVGYGMPGVRCDGNDVLASYAVTRDAVERARSGGGPTLIEAVTYRRGAHTTSDDAGRYRGDEEVARAERIDPLDRLRRLLVRRGSYDDDLECALGVEADRAAAEVRAGIYDAPHGDPLEVFDHVYEDRRVLDDQRRELRRALGRGDPESGA